jgi:hypothetical protein
VVSIRISTNTMSQQRQCQGRSAAAEADRLDMAGDQIAIADREVLRMKTPQADGSSAPLNATEKPRVPPKKRGDRKLDPGDAHIGATEDQVSETQPPSGEDYKDEPKQG